MSATSMSGAIAHRAYEAGVPEISWWVLEDPRPGSDHEIQELGCRQSTHKSGTLFHCRHPPPHGPGDIPRGRTRPPLTALHRDQWVLGSFMDPTIGRND